MNGSIWCLIITLSGCAFVPESALEERLDMDGDGVPRPTDCDDTDPSVTTNTWYADSDGDGYGNTTELQGCDLEEGYVAQGGDCLDDVAEVYPGAPEVCNEVDDDCDGETDEGLEVPVWYLDGDDDGFGGDDESVTACVAPSSEYTEQDGDCDDEDSAISPDGAEVCDGTDNDCDGLTDDEDPDTPLSTWYWDEDGDGAGDDTVTTQACAPPSGYVSADSADCDDEDPTSYPGAPELCDGTDNDCDETTGEDGVITLDGEANAETIQDALDLASEGSTVTVCDGTYTEALVISETLTLQSLGGAEVTTIDADSQGAAVAIVSTVDVTISGFTVTGGSGHVLGDLTQGGGVYGGSASTLAIVECVIEGNQADYGGGVILQSAEGAPTAALELTGSTVTGNVAVYGGGIYLDLAAASLDAASVISENEASSSGGGAILIDGGAVAGGTISGNSAEKGGGVYARGIGNLLSDVVIQENVVSSDGGGAYVETFSGSSRISTLDLGAATISANTAAGDGGGLYVDDSTATLVSSTITENVAGDSGGGVRLYTSGEAGEATIDVSGSTISSNTATYGGGIELYEANATLDSSSVVSENEASSGGGAFLYNGSSLTGGMISSNSAHFGGGAYSYGGDNLLVDTLIDGNTATDSGGGVRVISSGGSTATLDVSGTSITGNTAPYGGGIFLESSTATLGSGASVSLNEADHHGGGVFLYNGGSLTGGTISENTAPSGGGVSAQGGDVLLTEVIIDSNTASSLGGGLYVSSAEIELQSCGVESDIASTGGGGAFVASGELTSTASDWGSGPTDNQPDDVIIISSTGSSTTYSDFASSETFTCSSTAGSCE